MVGVDARHNTSFYIHLRQSPWHCTPACEPLASYNLLMAPAAPPVDGLNVGFLGAMSKSEHAAGLPCYVSSSASCLCAGCFLSFPPKYLCVRYNIHHPQHRRASCIGTATGGGVYVCALPWRGSQPPYIVQGGCDWMMYCLQLNTSENSIKSVDLFFCKICTD